MKKPLFKRITIIIKKKRTTISLTNIEYTVLQQIAAERGLSMSECAVKMIKDIQSNYDKRYGCTLAVRDAIIMKLLNKVYENE